MLEEMLHLENNYLHLSTPVEIFLKPMSIDLSQVFMGGTVPMNQNVFYKCNELWNSVSVPWKEALNLRN